MSLTARYECPNGHPVPPIHPLDCECGAIVVYEPAAKGMALARQLQGAVERADDIRWAAEFIRRELPASRKAWERADRLIALADHLSGGQ